MEFWIIQKLKQNRRLYGTDFIVLSPKVLKGYNSVNVILKAGLYNDEIKKDIHENINRKCNILVKLKFILK